MFIKSARTEASILALSKNHFPVFYRRDKSAVNAAVKLPVNSKSGLNSYRGFKILLLNSKLGATFSCSAPR
ncbi:hypothetical protein DDV23_04610 [Streptococcus chenjunshii]|uniref:Uncharacterized protein n=1 Tax=Streptococcus chenjunshii TaxID=2173853 RepID=A0A372KMH2_9STRE|nr:hypothetical protein DDV22_07430 [Streptococcus chenjunshii]RFU53482.1 hypothetical protein DDV23_04610 [Streptococcus chenjunshii]